MVKLNPKKGNKTSVKVTNKQQNKINKSKKRKSDEKKIKKALKQAKKEQLKNENEFDDNQDHSHNLKSIEDDLDNNFDSNKKRANKRKHIDNDTLESNYKVKSFLINNSNNNKKIQMALPIKTERGVLVKNVREVELNDENRNEEKFEEAKTSIVLEETIAEKPKSLVEQLQEKHEFFNKTKDKIAHYSRDIIENPQGEIKKLRELRNMLNQPGVRDSLILRKLIIVSMCEIFKDIVPSYKIRPWTEKEKEQNIGKDVQQLKEFEEGLVKQYKLYIDYLNDSIKGFSKFLIKSGDPDEFSKTESIKQFGIICVKCLCNLLQRLSHFNHVIDIIEVIVQQLTSKTYEIASLASQTIKTVYKEDKELHLSLDITQKITKMLKQKSYGVKPEVLDIFLALKLKEIHVVEEKNKKMKHKDKMKLSRAERKKQKEKEQLEMELEGKKAPERMKEKSKLQGRILEQIFMVYFNILKKSPNYKLIPSVLEGLSNFAHLIDLDFFDDLIKVMHNLIESDRLNFRSKLHCIKTVFIVLSGQGESLNIDPIKFYSSLYSIILQLNSAGDLNNTYLLSECIDMMFFKRRKQIPSSRLLAFIKRLSLLAVQLEPASSAIVLHIVEKLTTLNKSSDLLFDNEYQDNGIYNPELNDPDYVNAQNTSLWELHLLRRHYSKTVCKEANNVLKQNTMGLSELKITNNDILNVIKQEEESYEEIKKLKKKKF